MTNIDMIKELRALTSAGMKDCKEALEEANGDLQKAIDLIKIKGLNIADGRNGRPAAEGIVKICNAPAFTSMIEVNCQTDFVANSPDFKNFARNTFDDLNIKYAIKETFQVSDVEEERKALVALTKENIVVRRWWVEEPVANNARVFSYMHPNNKIGVILTLLAPSSNEYYNPDFTSLGENMAMQVAAMNPLSIDIERLSTEHTVRQQIIFEQQLVDANKPQAAWTKILEGKFRKWYGEVCLMEQEAVWVPKTTVKQAVANIEKALGGEIKVVTMIRCQVGEGIEKEQTNLAEEVAKLSGVDLND